MDIINNFAVLNYYKKNPLGLHAFTCMQNANQLMDGVVHYEKVEVEKFIIQRILQVLDAKSQAEYRKLVAKLSSPVPSTSSSSSTSTHSMYSAGIYTPSLAESQSDPFFNSVKQQWAHQLLTKLSELMTEVLKKETTSTLLQAIKLAIDTLIGQGTELSNEDYDTIYKLPTTIFSALESSSLKGADITTFVNKMAGFYSDSGTTSETAIFNLMAQAKVEALLDMVALLEQTSVSGDANFQLARDLLLGLQSVKTFSEEQFQQIAQANVALGVAISSSDLNRDTKIELARILVATHEDQVAVLKSYEAAMNAAEIANEHQLTVFNEVTSMVQSLMVTFSARVLGFSSAEEIPAESLAGAVQTARAIISRFDELTEEQQKTVNDAIEILDRTNYQSGKTSHLVSDLGVLFAYFMSAAAIAAKEDITPAEIKATIDAEKALLSTSSCKLAEYINTGLDKLKVSGDKGTATLDESSTTAATTIVELFTVASGKCTLGNSAITTLQKLMSFVSEKVASTIAAGFLTYKAKATELTQAATAKVQEYNKSEEAFAAERQVLYARQIDAQAAEILALQLPSAIATVLIKHFMPREVQYLTELYGDLYYSKLGSDVGTQILGVVSSYVNGSTYFDFADYVGHKVGKAKGFSGDIASAQAKLDSEREQAVKYYQATLEAQDLIEELVLVVKKDTKITEEQRLTLLTSLALYRDNFSSLAAMLNLLKNFLAPLKTEAISGEVGIYDVKGGDANWQTQLEALEDALINGIGGNPVVLGMFPFQATLQSDQQAFADKGHNDQLDLQRHLTAMQQEWTVVSTSLQLLNQMYLALARSLLK